MGKLKMYILILDWVDLGHAINSAAHGGLMGYLEWQQDPIMEIWLNNSFRKVTCKVTQKEFEKAKKYDNYLIITELSFDGKEVGLVFKSRYEWPKFFKYLKLYKEKPMQGKFLTRNIVLHLECLNDECDHTDTIDIETLRDLGEGQCPKCQGYLTVSQEFTIKN